MTELAASGINDRVLVYPSVMVRPVPSFMITKPEAWMVAELPQAVLTIGTPQTVDGVWVNASVVHERVMPALGIELAAKASWTRLKDASPGATLNGEEKMVTFADRETYLRGVNIPAAGPNPALAQVHSIFYGPQKDRPTVDLFQIICTCSHATIEDHVADFMDIVASFTFI